METFEIVIIASSLIFIRVWLAHLGLSKQIELHHAEILNKLNLLRNNIPKKEQLISFLQYVDESNHKTWITHEGIVRGYLKLLEEKETIRGTTNIKSND